MILQSLYNLYQILAQKGEITPEGRSKAKVSFAILLNDDGQPVDILPLKRTVVRGQREIEIPTILEVFLHESRSSGVKPNFLCDNAAYIFGIDAKKSERAKKCFLESAAYHLRMLSEVETPAAKSVMYFYETWNPDAAYEHPIIHKYERELEEGVNLVFRYKGQYVHTDSSIQKIWDKKRAERDDAIYGRCLITGIKAPIARLHPQIKGVRDAQTSGASLVSYNAAAYESFNKNQNHNAPVSETAAFAYTTALNHLLSDTEHVQVIGDTTFVYWAKNAEADYADIFTAGINPSLGVDKAQLTRAMREISRGTSYQLYGRTITPDMGFCILGLSPNAARLSVRCFYQDTFEAFSQRIVQHHNRMQIVNAFDDQLDELSIYQILNETVNKKSKDKRISPLLAGALMHAILNDTPYPSALFMGVIIRLRADRDVNRGRAAFIKAYLLKQPNNILEKEVLTVELNEKSNYMPYLLGRLFSILEGIQKTAYPTLNATIKDRYFNSACATPAVIFPILLKLKNNHLHVINRDRKNLAVFFENQIGSILNSIQQQFPVHLSLEEQGAFVLGYYHQTHCRYKSKEEK